MSDSFHPEMAFFPMSVVLREFAPAAFEEAVCDVLRVRLDENSCAALLIKKIRISELETRPTDILGLLRTC